MHTAELTQCVVSIPADDVRLEGIFTAPDTFQGLVLFAHGSGSSRRSARNQYVAHLLQDAGLATLLFDLLSDEEAAMDEYTRTKCFDIPLLAGRLLAAMDWARALPNGESTAMGLFGASTGAAAALVAAAARPGDVEAVVSRGGRPDLAEDSLALVTAPTLLIVGSEDHHVLELNRWAQGQMHAPCRLAVVPGAGHLFEEPGTLETAAHLARDFFLDHLPTVP